MKRRIVSVFLRGLQIYPVFFTLLDDFIFFAVFWVPIGPNNPSLSDTNRQTTIKLPP